MVLCTTQIGNAKNEAVTTAKNYTDTTVEAAKTALTTDYEAKIDTAKTEAKGYTDTKVTAAKTELNGKIADNRTAINKNRADIDRNTATIASHYAEMKNNFAAVNTRIDTLDKKMKRGFASQAALNGLFQPYNVGKFNVTAAIGGYDSEQAMAIGTGYRFNENIAVKAGIARAYAYSDSDSGLLLQKLLEPPILRHTFENMHQHLGIASVDHHGLN